jgi:hypothetical protein
MNATYLAFLGILLIPHIVWSQNIKNNLRINTGASSGYGYPSGLTSTANSGIPTINLSGEYAINNLISVGIYGAYTYTFYKYNDPMVGYKDVWKGWDLGVRSNIHLGSWIIKNNKADLYAGVFSGYITRSLVYDRSNIYRDSLSYSINALNIGGLTGIRYYINPRFGLFCEAGFSRKFFIGAGVSFIIHSK